MKARLAIGYLLAVSIIAVAGSSTGCARRNGDCHRGWHHRRFHPRHVWLVFQRPQGLV